jgi:WD40 repeat protein
VLVRQGKLDRATRVMAHALKVCPDRDSATLAEDLATSAEVAAELLDYDAARAYASKLLEMADASDVMKQRAKAALAAAEQGAVELASAREITPRTRQLVDQSNALAAKGDDASLRTAREGYLAAWKAQPNSIAALGLGRVARRLGNDAEAQTFLDRAFSLLKAEKRTPRVVMANRSAMTMWMGWSSDGRFIAFANGDINRGGDNELSLFEAETGREHLHLFGLGSSDDPIAFSNDGKLLGVKTSSTGFVMDMGSRVVVREFADLPDSTMTAFSPDFGRLAASGVDETFVLDLARRSRIDVFGGLPENTTVSTGVAFSPDGHTIAFPLQDDRIILWNTDSRAISAVLAGHKSPIMNFAFSHDGKRFITSPLEPSEVRMWDTRSGALKRTISIGANEFVGAIAISSDGSLIATSGGNGASVWDAKTGAVRTTLGELVYPTKLAFSPDGRRLAIDCLDYEVCVVDTTSGALVKQTPSRDAALSSFAISPDGKILAARPSDGTLRLVDLKMGVLRKTLLLADDDGQVAFAGNGKLLGVTAGQMLRIVNAETGATIREEKFSVALAGLALSPDGSQIAVGVGKDIRVLSHATNDPPRTFSGHSSRVLALAFSPDGTLLASGAIDKTVRTWDVATGTEKHNMAGHTRLVKSVAFSPDGKLLASGAFDKTVRVWDVATGTSRQTFQPKKPGILETVIDVAFSPDGTMLAVGGDDDALRIWDLASGEERVMHSARADALSVAFTPDGQWLVAGWQNGTLLFQPPAGKGPTVSLRFVNKEDAGHVIDSNGHADLLGQNPCAAHAQLFCRAGNIGLPFDLCEERAFTSGLLARVLAKEPLDDENDDPAHSNDPPRCGRSSSDASK